MDTLAHRDGNMDTLEIVTWTPLRTEIVTDTSMNQFLTHPMQNFELKLEFFF